MSDVSEQAHLDPEDLACFLSGELDPKRRQFVETHLDQCPDCLTTMAAVQRVNRAENIPQNVEEAAALAAIQSRSEGPTPDQIRARAADSSSGASGDLEPFRNEPFSRRELMMAAAAIIVGLGLAHVLYNRVLDGRIPTIARPDPLELLASARNGTGRIPLRYIRGFERANITRSSFDEDPDLSAVVELAREQAAGETTAEGMMVLGLVLLDDGALDEAESWLTRARERDPREPDILNGLAVLNYARAQSVPTDTLQYHQRGLSLLREAERLKPNDLQVLYNYGMFYESMENLEAAAVSWRRYLELDDETEWAAEATARLKLLDPSEESEAPEADEEPDIQR